MVSLGRLLCQSESGTLTRRTKRDLGVVIGSAALAWVLASPGSARACSIAAPPAALVGYPANGQVGVPTDVVPFYDMSTARIGDIASAEFELLSAAGDAIALLAEERYSRKVELVPASPLLPNTKYRIRLAVPNGESVNGVEFITGSGAYEGTPAPPSASLQHYQLEYDSHSSCGPSRTGTCVMLDGSVPVEVSYASPGGVDPTYVYLQEASFLTNLSGIEQGTPYDCVVLRARAPNGVFSEPVERCREDGAMLTFSNAARLTCTSAGLLHEPLPQPEPDETTTGEVSPPKGDGAADDGDGNDGPARKAESVSCSISAPSAHGLAPLLGLVVMGGAIGVLRRFRGRRSRALR
jgi:hypothetical protein